MMYQHDDQNHQNQNEDPLIETDDQSHEEKNENPLLQVPYSNGALDPLLIFYPRHCDVEVDANSPVEISRLRNSGKRIQDPLVKHHYQ